VSASVRKISEGVSRISQFVSRCQYSLRFIMKRLFVVLFILSVFIATAVNFAQSESTEAYTTTTRRPNNEASTMHSHKAMAVALVFGFAYNLCC